MTERQERKKREFNMRRREILNQAEKIFAAKDYYAVTMAEIARASGFSIGSLYHFFNGKEDLYSRMISEKMDLMYAETRKAVDSVSTVMEKIEMFVDAHLLFAENNSDFCRLFVRGESAALSQVINSLREKLLADYFAHITFLENLLKDGIEKKLFRDLTPRFMAEALFHLIKASLFEWMLDPIQASPRSHKNLILNIFFDGVKHHGSEN
ncbi:MAG TPA: TetR/AcrR family transcriptional regulator [Smithella sp.]|nr:TetR/AcrR family transcriptional regulator [Smithella sp.]